MAAAPVESSGAVIDPQATDLDELVRHRLIYDLEKAARGHGLDVDRHLHTAAAQALRNILGLQLDEELLYPAPASPYPVRPVDPPIGHSLPGDSDR